MKNNFFVFFIIICCLLTVPVFLSGPAAALDTGKVTIIGKVPLVIYNISVIGIDRNHATITWKTNGNANSTVVYGTTTSYGSFRTAGVMAKDHTIPLSGLLPGTLYHFRVISVDLAGNRAESADLTFTTAPSPTPPTPPPTPRPTTRPTTAPTPTPTPIPYYNGGGGGGGGGRSYTFTWPWTIPQAVLPVQTSQPGQTQQPGQPDDPACHEEVSQNYTAGFVGLLYNADGNNTLDLDISKAKASGAAVTIEPDHIDVYQHESPGVLFRFWLDTSDIRNTTRIVKPANSAELWTDPLVANFTTGTFSGSLHASPTRVLPPSMLNITLSRCIPPWVTERILTVSAQNNLEPNDVVYTMKVVWVHLPETSAANATMTLPASWVDQLGGSDSIHIAGISDGSGTTELLNTVVLGRDPSGTGIFQGDSTHGASLFALFSARQNGDSQQQEQSPQNIPINLLVIAGILVIVLIALVLILIMFGRRQKKKS